MAKWISWLIARKACCTLLLIVITLIPNARLRRIRPRHRRAEHSAAFLATRTTGIARTTTRADKGGTSTRGTRVVTADHPHLPTMIPSGMPTTSPTVAMTEAWRRRSCVSFSRPGPGP